MKAEEELIRQTKLAQAEKDASELLAEKVRIEAEAKRDAAEKDTAAAKMLAEAEAATKAAPGLAEATVQEAKAVSLEKEGLAEATVLEKKAVAEAKGIEAKASAIEKQGLAEANVDLEKYRSEATGITEKAEAMKQLDSVGKEHEEFKLELEKQKTVEIAAINAQRGIAESQAGVVGDALKSARIDIVGGDGEFFEQITSAVKGGKAIDRFVYNSKVATDIKDTFFDGNAEYFRDQLIWLDQAVQPGHRWRQRPVDRGLDCQNDGTGRHRRRAKPVNQFAQHRGNGQHRRPKSKSAVGAKHASGEQRKERIRVDSRQLAVKRKNRIALLTANC